MSYYFTIIGTSDNPIYELEFSSFKLGGVGSTYSSQTQHIPGKSQFSTEVKELIPFITHSSLDLIEDSQWNSNQFYLGRIDSFYGVQVTAFITQGNIKFVICSDSNGGKYDENASRQFFIDVNELYVKCLMNPFYGVNDPITSPDFDLRVKMLARKYL